MSLVTKYSESPVKLMENQKLVEIEFPASATDIIGLKTDNLTKIDVSKCSKDFVNMIKNSYEGNVEIVSPVYNVIEYTASAELTKATSNSSSGLHTNAFNATFRLHTFNEGKGVITFYSDVTLIGNYAFKGCSGLTEITIPDSVTEIGSYAFQSCSGLTSVEIPDSVTSIGERAFNGCTGLTSINIPDGVTEIGDYTFYGCM